MVLSLPRKLSYHRTRMAFRKMPIKRRLLSRKPRQKKISILILVTEQIMFTHHKISSRYNFKNSSYVPCKSMPRQSWARVNMQYYWSVHFVMDTKFGVTNSIPTAALYSAHVFVCILMSHVEVDFCYSALLIRATDKWRASKIKNNMEISPSHLYGLVDMGR